MATGKPDGSKARRGVLILDVENLLYHHLDGDLDRGLETLRRTVRALEEEMTLVVKVASCSRRLAARLAIPLGQLGIRTHVHNGGADAADEDLIRRLEEHVPESCDVVVIGSGDHRFALPARGLQNLGKRVIAVARPGSMSNVLRQVAGGFRWIGNARQDEVA